MSEDLLTVSEAAARLKIHDGTLRRMLQAGKIKGLKFGAREWRVPEGELNRFIETRLSQRLPALTPLQLRVIGTLTQRGSNSQEGDGPDQYSVVGLPGGQGAMIARMDLTWQILRIRDGIADHHWSGNFPDANSALVAIEEEVQLNSGSFLPPAEDDPASKD